MINDGIDRHRDQWSSTEWMG